MQAYIFKNISAKIGQILIILHLKMFFTFKAELFNGSY